MASLPVYQGHVDVEYAEKRVRLVLNPSCGRQGSPCHALRHLAIGRLLVVKKDGHADVGDGVQVLAQTRLWPDLGPISGVELNSRGCDEFLERPSTREPPASLEQAIFIKVSRSVAPRGGSHTFAGRYVYQVCVADVGQSVPHVHGVDSF